MDTNHLPLDQIDLRFFAMLCRQQSLTVTAQRLGLSNSAASRVLAHLREVFNEPLFNRGREGLVPTARALVLLPRVEKILDGYDGLFREDDFDPRAIQRRVRIACSDNASVDILGRVVPLILEKSPEIAFDIIPIEDGIVPRLRSGEIDFGIYPSEKAAPGIHSALIYESRYRYVVRKGHPLETLYAVQKTLTSEDLKRYRFVNVGLAPGPGIQAPMAADVQQANLPGAAQVRTAYILSQPELIRRTDLVGMMPEAIVHQLQAMGMPLVTLCETLVPLPHRPHLLWHDRSDHDPVTSWIRALFVHAFHEGKRSLPTKAAPQTN